LRIAVVSPFLDRRHGAERCVVEQIEYFCQQKGSEIHIYSQSVQDLEVVRYSPRHHSAEPSRRPIWHRLPSPPGPHLFNFVWWFFTNTLLRWYHRAFCSLSYDVVYSPGINCPDADAIVVHVVFHELLRHVRESLRLRSTPFRSWPATIHRNLYYRLIMFLEVLIYRKPKLQLAAVSKLTARELSQTAQRDDITVIPNAVDGAKFNLDERLRRRTEARAAFHFQDSDFVLLLIGNGWKNKGLHTLLEALGILRFSTLKLLVVGRDDQTPFQMQLRKLQIVSQVIFVQPSADVLRFYAAADAYSGPSLHDSFALPPLEAMASGLPVITSAQNGGSQIITDGVDGFILNDPVDSTRLAEIIRNLAEHPALCREIGAKAASTANSYTWERNASETWSFVSKACGASNSD